MHYVGIGPRTNFRARRWWDRAENRRTRPASCQSNATRRLAHFAGAGDVARPSPYPSCACSSADMRAHAVIRGCDCWPLVRGSSRASRCCSFPGRRARWTKRPRRLPPSSPEVAVTYAEAGRLGTRARARVPPARHSPRRPAARIHLPPLAELPARSRTKCSPIHANQPIRGFPLPAATLLFDEHAARQLRRPAAFRRDRLRVTGSARLDELVGLGAKPDAGRHRARPAARPAPATRAAARALRRQGTRGAAVPAGARRGGARRCRTCSS